MRPKRLLSHIEVDELYEAKRCMGGYEEGQTHEYYVKANQLLHEKGLVQIVDSQWADDNPTVKEVIVTDAGSDEHLRYQRLPRYEDELIQAIDYLETHRTQISLTITGTDQTYPIPSDTTLSETLIMLAAMLRDMAGAK